MKTAAKKEEETYAANKRAEKTQYRDAKLKLAAAHKKEGSDVQNVLQNCKVKNIFYDIKFLFFTFFNFAYFVLHSNIVIGEEWVANQIPY